MQANYGNKYFVLSVTTLGSLMAALDATIVYLALPNMGHFFNTPLSYLTWVIVAYLIAIIATMIPAADLAKKVDKKKLYLSGFIIFALSSLFVALSPNIFFVIAFRFIEGIGAGILTSTGIPILLSSFPPEERGKAVGINSISWAIGTMTGPIMGGFLVMYDWRYIFLINVPIGFIAMLLGIKRIPSEPGNKAAKVNRYSSISLIAFIIPMVIAITFANLYFLIIAVLLLPLFLYLQYRKPLIPGMLLRNKQYSTLLIASALQAIAFFSVLYSLSVYLQDDIGLTPFDSGLYLFTYPLASMIANPISGYLLDKTGKGDLLLAIGLSIQSGGILTLGITMKFIPELLFISGFGGSIFWAPSTTLVVDSAGRELRSIANGSLFTVRNIALSTVISFLPIFLSSFSGGTVSVGDLFVGFSGLDLKLGTSYYIITTALVSFSAIVPVILYRRFSKSKRLASVMENV